MSDIDLAYCQDILRYQFKEPQLLRQAFTHASAAANRAASNERMEFLGDAVLGLVICQDVFCNHPELLEGEMTKIKSSVVSRQTCAVVSARLGLPGMLDLGKGVGPTEGLPTSVEAAVLESVIGAIYIDGGLEPAREFILREMDEVLSEAVASTHQRNFKSLLQQYAQRELGAMPVYELLDEKGPEHSKCFEMAVRLNGRHFPSAWGKNKKESEQKAALAALYELGVVDSDEFEQRSTESMQ